MEETILFLMTFVFVYIIYFLVVIRKELKKEYFKNNPNKKKKNKKKKDDYAEGKIPVEVQYLLSRYSLNLDKISYRGLLYSIAFVSALDISIAVTVVSFVSGIVWQLLVGFLVIMPLILISFHIVGTIYKKKGSK